MQGRTKNDRIDEQVNELLCTPSVSDPSKSIAQVLLDNSYNDADLQFFAVTYSFPSNKDYKDDNNSYTGFEVARAFVDTISPYLTSQEIYDLTQRAISIECQYSDGPLRKTTLAKALLNKILIDHKNDGAEPGRLPEQFLMHISSDAVIGKLFGSISQRLNEEDVSALRTANLAIHDLFIKMLLEANAITSPEAARYGYKEYSFEDMIAKKPDNRVFENYYHQIIQVKNRAGKGKEEAVSNEADNEANTAEKHAFLDRHLVASNKKTDGEAPKKTTLSDIGRTLSQRFAKTPTPKKATSVEQSGSPKQTTPPRKAYSMPEKVKSPKLDFRAKLASLRLEAGMFNEIENAITKPERLNESIKQAGYIGYSNEGKRVKVGLNDINSGLAPNSSGEVFGSDGNLINETQFKFDSSMDERVNKSLQLYFNVDRNTLNDRQVIIYSGLGFGCSQHPTMGTMMGEAEFRPDAKGRANINLSTLNNAISERIFKTLGISVDTNGVVSTTQNMEQAKKAYNAISRLIDFYNAALADKSLPKKDLKALEKLLSSIHSILEKPTHDFSKNIINAMNSEYEKYFQETKNKRVNPELTAYRQGLLNIINGRNYDTNLTVKAPKTENDKLTESSPLRRSSSQVSQAGMFGRTTNAPPIPPKPAPEKTREALESLRKKLGK